MELVIKFFLLLFLLDPALGLASGLSIPEIDPYAVLEKDQKKNDAKKEPTTRDQKEKQTSELDKERRDSELPYFCDTAKEFEKIYSELKKSQLIDFPEREIIQISYEVTKGCDGSAERFKKVLELLIKSGVDKRKSVEIALHFSKKSNEQVTAFILIFKGTFLEKFMDIDFKTALTTSLKLALNARGNPETVARDFRTMLNYCLDHKTTGLSMKTCAPYVLELSEYSFLYEKSSLGQSFEKMMKFFETQKEIDYSLGRSFRMTLKILKHGPKAVENFEKQFEYGISNEMKLPQKTALELAIKVAENTISL